MFYVLLVFECSLNFSLQPSGINQNTVGRRQDVICSISVPPDVDSDTIEFGWLYKDDIITNDSRVSIGTSNINSTLITTIQFNLLFEEDEGDYICYVINNGSLNYDSINLQNFTSKLFCLFKSILAVFSSRILYVNMYVCVIIFVHIRIYTKTNTA